MTRYRITIRWLRLIPKDSDGSLALISIPFPWLYRKP